MSLVRDCDLKTMEKITTPIKLCVHGTYEKYIDSIKQNGLSKMTRTHIYLSSCFPDDSMIHNCTRDPIDTFIIIDMKKALDDGIEFYSLSDGVILTEGINGILDSKYFKNTIYKYNEQMMS